MNLKFDVMRCGILYPMPWHASRFQMRFEELDEMSDFFSKLGNF